MGHTPEKLLWDAKVATDRIFRFIAGKSFGDYLDDEMLRAAVERQFEIIGEALTSLKRTAPDIANQIPELSRIIAFRNVLIHEYAAVDNRLVWGVAEGKLEDLRSSLDRLLAEAKRS